MHEIRLKYLWHVFSFLGLALLLFLWLPSPWRYLGGIFVVMFAFSMILLIDGVKKRNWLIITKQSGDVALSIPISSWSFDMQDSFRKNYLEFMETPPNHSPDPTPAPGMPPAGQESRHG
jgi:hypothetical protein